MPKTVCVSSGFQVFARFDPHLSNTFAGELFDWDSKHFLQTFRFRFRYILYRGEQRKGNIFSQQQPDETTLHVLLLSTEILLTAMKATTNVAPKF